MIFEALDWLHNSCVPYAGWDYCFSIFMEWLNAYNAWWAMWGW
jgi:hypothetical protein